jgi:hypothetical protein
VRLILILWGRLHLRSGELHSCILGNGVGDARGHQADCAVVIAVAQVRNHLAPEAADLTVRQDGLEAIAHRHVILTVLRGQKDEHTAVLAFFADAPLLIKLNGVVEDVGALEGVDSHHGNLGLSFLINLGAEVLQL